MLNSAIVCLLVAALFWVIGFGVDTSPSISRLLVTVTLPAFIVGDYIRYRLATRKYGFIGQVPARASAA